LEHLQHVGLSVTGGDIRVLHVPFTVCVFHTVKAAVDSLQGRNKEN